MHFHARWNQKKKVFTFTYLQNAVTSFVVEISMYFGRAQTQPLERINVVSLQTDSDKDSVDGNTGELTVTGNDVTLEGVSGSMVTGTTDIPSLPTEPLWVTKFNFKFQNLISNFKLKNSNFQQFSKSCIDEHSQFVGLKPSGSDDCRVGP